MHTWRFEARPVRPRPRTPLWSGFTKDSLPIGTEIDVDGYLATTAERPAAMSRFRMEESCVWHRPVPMLWTRKNDRWAPLTAGRPENTSAARRAWIQAPASSENAPPQQLITGRAQQ